MKRKKKTLPKNNQPYKRYPLDPVLYPQTRAKLRVRTLAQKRKKLYILLSRKNKGVVLCYVCGKPVEYEEASLEHIRPLSKGGTDAWGNLAISHELCNQARGNDWQDPRELSRKP